MTKDQMLALADECSDRAEVYLEVQGKIDWRDLRAAYLMMERIARATDQETRNAE